MKPENDTTIHKTDKFPVMETSILMVPLEGIHVVTTYWSDGTVTEKRERRSPKLFIEPLRIF